MQSKNTPQTQADFILYGGPIYTVDKEAPQVEAISISGKKILSIGCLSDILQFQGPMTRMIDLQGKTIVPGFIESHGHIQGMGRSRAILGLQGKSKNEILNLVKEKAQRLHPGEWIIGRGWDQNTWPEKKFPHKFELDQVSLNHPVYLTRVDGHGAWVNSVALNLALENQNRLGTPYSLGVDPKGGQVVLDESNQPSGILIDNSMDWVTQVIPPYSLEQKVEFIKLAQDECLRLGITSFHDAGSNEDILPAYDYMLTHKHLYLRLYIMLMGNNPRLLAKYYESGPRLGENLTIRSIKLYADGALGSCGALLFSPYNHAQDLRDPCGLELLSEDEIFEIAKDALNFGFQVCTHAIGDKANHLVLNAYQRALENSHSVSNHRFRIEHAQLLNKKDLPRFYELGVIASMQASHCTSDMSWIEDKIGAIRAKEEGYLWRSMVDSKACLCNGSDVPIESANPLWGFYSSLTRQDHQGNPLGGWNPSQCLTREEALHSFTLAGAYASFSEEQKGGLVPGKLADLVILSQDIMKIPEVEILNTKVLATMIDGVFRYQDDMFII